MKTRIGHLALELDVAALRYLEVVQGDSHQRVAHHALVDGIASPKLHVVLEVVGQRHLTPTLQVDIVVAHVAQEAVNLRGLGNIDIHLHVYALALHVDGFRGNRVVEINKGDNVRELVVDGQWRIGQDTAHVGTAQHVEFSAHPEVVGCAPKPSAKVDENLTISQ